MAFDFKLPDLGEGIAEVELRRWLVAEGDAVREHQPLLEVETDKAVVEVPSPRSGVVSGLRRKEGETVQVGEVLLTLADREAEPKLQAAEQRPAPRPASVGIVGSLPEAEEEPLPAVAGAFEGLATPMVRKLARERGIDLRSIKGSGPRGCIRPEDLDRQLPPAARVMGGAGPEERVPLRGLRRTIARNVTASQRITAFVTSMEEVDITDVFEMRSREQGEVESRGTHLTFLPFFMKAVQHALKEHPLLNASIDDETQELVLKRHYHFGIAVDTPEGLMVPVIRDVDKKSIIELAQAIQELGRKARERSIALDELKGSSFTITNYGHFGGTFATPIINWPDVAIMGFGRIVERPWVHRGEIAIRKILPLSLTFDHRATDGADAARFLGKVLRYLEDPALLFLDCG
ncbi:2-oxo acid dehydrogenase subunit E2 [Geomonas sp. Red69]|uniref:Dihydrolipoamide acetyltransferase component of pyruvate dehydrogenase complex n=1 Tax=Geomonas diazotrophica TaxID=2843197 RepID=A0ABX8JHR6_9BACT|nr:MULTISPECIES: dihydrolipoamide acetyltransferase family protein [Geomonas]MBU5637423.1 2-oxo acid dehydrogenase subunit E2 [Geomonas diazotrophica]QWV97909.1 2-oxo acid dehydrogenase subunit E2 [Geomonas nitrogeniifigens]QXE87049.1 2-oxo acid dehydrogenase subunit E2 [Geomonas nitrogeniifigens]